MSQIPYETSTKTCPASQPGPTRWMIFTGCILLGLAAACLITTVAMMMWSFGELANPNTAPQPSDMANGISTAMISQFAAIPLGMAGIAFLIIGFIRRQTVTSA